MRSALKQKKKMRFLLALSLTSGWLDPRKIAFIAETLKRKELKTYLLLLEKRLQEEKVTVITAIPATKIFMNRLKKLFSGKEIFFKRDPHMLAGMQVLFSDYVFDASFRYYLECVKRYYEID